MVNSFLLGAPFEMASRVTTATSAAADTATPLPKNALGSGKNLSDDIPDFKDFDGPDFKDIVLSCLGTPCFESLNVF